MVGENIVTRPRCFVCLKELVWSNCCIDCMEKYTQQDAQIAALKAEIERLNLACTGFTVRVQEYKAEIERLKEALAESQRCRLRKSNIERGKQIEILERGRGYADAEIERLKKGLDRYYKGQESWASRARAWKMAAKEWGRKFNEDSRGEGYLREAEFYAHDKNRYLVILTKTPPDWREEAKQYLEGKIKLTTPSKYDTPNGEKG